MSLKIFPLFLLMFTLLACGSVQEEEVTPGVYSEFDHLVAREIVREEWIDLFGERDADAITQCMSTGSMYVVDGPNEFQAMRDICGEGASEYGCVSDDPAAFGKDPSATDYVSIMPRWWYERIRNPEYAYGFLHVIVQQAVLCLDSRLTPEYYLPLRDLMYNAAERYAIYLDEAGIAIEN